MNRKVTVVNPTDVDWETYADMLFYMAWFVPVTAPGAPKTAARPGPPANHTRGMAAGRSWHAVRVGYGACDPGAWSPGDELDGAKHPPVGAAGAWL